MSEKQKDLSIVIPTFRQSLSHEWLGLVNSLRLGREWASDEGLSVELVVVDTKSSKEFLTSIDRFADKIISSDSNSRGFRLDLGFKASIGGMLLFHHPRSILEPEAILNLAKKTDQKIWGGFTHCFDSNHWFLRWTSWYSNNVRFKRGVVYLDHCIFAHRELVEQINGVPNAEIFEDTLLSYRLGAFLSPVRLTNISTTSSIRFLKEGIFSRSFKNQALKLLFYLGNWKKAKNPNGDFSNLNRKYEKSLHLNSSDEP